MARIMRKQNLKIQMLAGNNLKSCPDTRSKKTVTLVYLFIDQITDINIKRCDEYSYCVAMHEYDIGFVFYQLVCFYIFFKDFFTAIK